MERVGWTKWTGGVMEEWTDGWMGMRMEAG